jgi:hypothetical protein
MIIALSGLSGTGKDTAADILVRNHGFVKVSLADPLKRICRDVFNFTDDQLWGPSESRNAPDKRYPRKHGPWKSVVAQRESKCACCGKEEGRPLLVDIESGYVQKRDSIPLCHLTPRHALQQLGTEWARNCYDDVWVDYAVRVYETLQRGDHYYDAKTGLRTTTSVAGVMEPKKNVVISDVRFRNEIAGLKKAGAKLIRIKRPGHEQPKWDHPSETEQMAIPDEEFNLVINNQDSLEDLAENISFILGNDILNHE